MKRLTELLQSQPVIFVNLAVALATVLAAFGLDLEPEAVGGAVVALLASGAALWPNVFAPATVDKIVDKDN